LIRVYLADDEKLIRQGLRKLLELGEGAQVVGEAADGEEVVRELPRHEVDVLLLDVRMPRRNGLERETKERGECDPPSHGATGKRLSFAPLRGNAR